MKITIIGAGNIGLALADGIVRSGEATPADITLTRRNTASLNTLTKKGFRCTTHNKDAIKNASVIFICVLPQQLNECLQEIGGSINPAKQLLVSVVTGAFTEDIRKRVNTPGQLRIIRAMPNTAMKAGQSMTCIAASNATQKDIQLVKKIFDAVGSTLLIKEELMSAATALCACGTAFFLRAIRAASQGGVEIGFHAEEAIHIAAQTALGAAALLLQSGQHPEAEIDKVTSPQGCTIAGLNEMEHQGFSSAMIKGIKLSANIAKGLYKS
jgi:pyrroline-5-carboxylate reductase